MEDGVPYPLLWTAKSSRFLTDTGFYQMRLILPKGISWDSICARPTIDGNPPVYTSVMPTPDGGSVNLDGNDLIQEGEEAKACCKKGEDKAACKKKEGEAASEEAAEEAAE